MSSGAHDHEKQGALIAQQQFNFQIFDCMHAYSKLQPAHPLEHLRDMNGPSLSSHANRPWTMSILDRIQVPDCYRGSSSILPSATRPVYIWTCRKIVFPWSMNSSRNYARWAAALSVTSALPCPCSSRFLPLGRLIGSVSPSATPATWQWQITKTIIHPMFPPISTALTRHSLQALSLCWCQSKPHCICVWVHSMRYKAISTVLYIYIYI